MATKYTYSIIGDFPYQKINSPRLIEEIGNSDITIALDYINTSDNDCDIWFKNDLSSDEQTTLSETVSAHSGEQVAEIEEPRDADGKLLVRADSRPVGTQTYFTTSGDDTEIGDGSSIFWDFSNDDDLVTGAPSGYKMKRVKMSFCDIVWLKEGSIYFTNAIKGCYLHMSVVCPSGNYYLDSSGNPAYASVDVKLAQYVNKHFISGSCPMGDELNTEACQISGVPPNYEFWAEIITPDNDNSSYGWGELELYRVRTVLLPGESL